MHQKKFEQSLKPAVDRRLTWTRENPLLIFPRMSDKVSEDCLECRITGTATLGTLSAYFLKESHQASRKYGGKNKVFFGVTGVTFAVAAGYRWFGMKQE